MRYERLDQLLDELERARLELIDALGVLGEAMIDRSRLSDPEFRLSDGIESGTRLHETLISALDRMHACLAAVRAEGVRLMVDEEGMSITDVAELVDRPRQLVSRLYAKAARGVTTVEPRP